VLHQLPDITRFVRADFEDVPLADNSIDLGIFVHTLHHALRFNHKHFRRWAAPELSNYQYLNCFYPYHPLIYRRIIPAFEMLRMGELFKLLYYIANTLLIPLHSKMVILLKRA